MALEQKLRLKLAQRLVMTPSLQQAIKLLQLSRLELEETLAQEILENPMLDVEESTEEVVPPRTGRRTRRNPADEGTSRRRLPADGRTRGRSAAIGRRDL